MQIADAATTLEIGLKDKVSQHIIAFSGVCGSEIDMQMQCSVELKAEDVSCVHVVSD